MKQNNVVEVIGAFMLVALLGAGCGGQGADPTAAPLQRAARSPVAPARTRAPAQVMPWRDPQHAASVYAPPAGSHLTYYGGHVLSNVKVVVVFWGANVNTTTTNGIGGFYTAVTNSAYFDWLSEYNTTVSGGTNQTVGRGTYAGSYTISPSTGTSGTIDDSRISTELDNQIGAGHLPRPDANTWYAIYFPAGVTITMGGYSSCVSGGFCAYHNTYQGTNGELFYGVMPDVAPGSGCNLGCGTDLSWFNNLTSVSSHELIETVTDAEIGLVTGSSVAAPAAWYDANNGEIGDICNADQGSVAGYTVQKEFDNATGTCIVSKSTSNDFSLGATPSSATVTAGSATHYTVSTTVTSGSAQSVSLSVSGLPTGATGSFSPTPVTAGSSSTLTVSTSSTTPAGTYALTITGTGASATHTTSVTLVVSSGTTTNDFSLSATPSSATVTAGSATSYAVSTAVTSGSAQSVSLSVSGLPTGATGSFSPTPVTAGSSSTLTVSTSSTTPAGTYALTITGTGPSATHTTSVTLVVSSPSSGNPIQNPGFESGDNGAWTTTSHVVNNDSTLSHTGSWEAYLCGYGTTVTDTLLQTVTVPSNATTLSFWMYISTDEFSSTTNYDTVKVQLRSTSGSVLTTLFSGGNLNATSGYVQKSYDISAYRGKTIQIYAIGSEDSSLQTSFLFDDFSIQ